MGTPEERERVREVIVVIDGVHAWCLNVALFFLRFALLLLASIFTLACFSFFLLVFSFILAIFPFLFKIVSSLQTQTLLSISLALSSPICIFLSVSR